MYVILYFTILHILHYFTEGKLMDRAELEPYLQEHIHTTFVAARFTESEWVALYVFKLNHNDNSCVKFWVSEAYEIVI